METPPSGTVPVHAEPAPSHRRTAGGARARDGGDGKLRAFLGSLQLADSAFPSGRYTLSHGLEAFVQAGLVDRSTPPRALVDLLADQIRHGVGPSDGTALACAHRAAGDTDGTASAGRADTRLSEVKLPREVRETSVRTGRALLATATAAFGDETVTAYARQVRAGRWPGNAAVVLGLVAASLGIDREHAVAGELYSFASGWLTAAVRLAIIDHLTVQALLHTVTPVLAETARDSCAAGVDDIAACTPMIDIMSMRHEHAPLRLFMS
ncbi:urease accessory UreF family protein [Streptomyces sp. TRM 70351]|uniref:urease accessory protein UreF n=1 Tax=Streptomyces sp. TRM 70351 TaxID=3116552 RepID=UPI002E7C238A|nr:urease accessory UreF family protein [Streptomyces sp. TRM 70351]MEE1928790.1 urease accessory UreF family protein [Streptomyces sp. TRM 70351]